jgi:hypothetical protein
LGSAEHKSESTWILSDSEAIAEVIGQPLSEYSKAGTTKLLRGVITLAG